MSTLARKSTSLEWSTADFEILVRVAKLADRDFVMSLIPRLVAFGLPAWRDPRRMLAAEIDLVSNALAGVRSDAIILIVEDRQAVTLGFVHVHAATDCHTHEREGHVAQMVIVDGPHELAAGRALIAAAEEWTRSRGYRVLTQGEFWSNHSARGLCKRLGFVEEIVKYRKAVR